MRIVKIIFEEDAEQLTGEERARPVLVLWRDCCFAFPQNLYRFVRQRVEAAEVESESLASALDLDYAPDVLASDAPESLRLSLAVKLVTAVVDYELTIRRGGDLQNSPILHLGGETFFYADQRPTEHELRFGNS